MMKSRKFILKADSFKYPYREERKIVSKKIPKISCFQFNSDIDINIVFQEFPLEEIVRKSSLFWWNNCLISRLGRLRETYVYAMTCYHRGFSEDYSDCSEAEITNKFLFEYYAEIFYYYFFSTRDVVSQLINVYYCLDIQGYNVSFGSRTFIDGVKKKDLHIGKILEEFKDNTKKATEIRNKFAHKFSPNRDDYRPVFYKDNGINSLEFGINQRKRSNEIVENIEETIESFAQLMRVLTSTIK